MLQAVKKLYNTWKNRPNYKHRYELVLFFIVVYILLRIIFAIVSYATNELEQKQAWQQGSIDFKTTLNRLPIVDRNGVSLADNILISTVALDPPKNLQISGFNNVNSIWRVKKTCNNSEKITRNCWKFLAKNAKQLFKKNLNNNTYLEKINLAVEVAKILNLDTDNFITYLQNNNCENCAKYKIIAKKLRWTSSIIQTLLKFKNQEFLICRDKVSSIGRLREFSNKYLSWVLEKKEPTEYIKCSAETIGGITVRNTTKRFYPYSPSTTPLIGALNQANNGVFGIENYFNNTLQNKEVKTNIVKPSASWKNPYKKLLFAQNNNALHLTIDSNIQFELFNAIRNSVAKYNAKSGAGIIINPNGEVIAMTSYPSSDVNLGINGVDNYSHFINRAVNDTLDTASTIKPITALIALETGVLQQDDILDITQSEGIKKFKVEKDRKFISIGEIIRESHGLGAIKMGKKIQDKDFYNYLNQLGFGQSLGVFPNENIGFLRSFYHWSPTDKKRLSFGGYGVINTTLAQIARSYLVFLNQGKIKNLKLFKNTKNEEYQIFSPENIEYIKNAMIAAVNDGGTGKKAKLKKVIAAGKTGTAQLLIDGKYSNSKHNTMFVGFAPANNPQYLMVVNIKAPDGWFLDGGSVAAPIFKEVMDKVLKD